MHQQIWYLGRILGPFVWLAIIAILAIGCTNQDEVPTTVEELGSLPTVKWGSLDFSVRDIRLETKGTSKTWSAVMLLSNRSSDTYDYDIGKSFWMVTTDGGTKTIDVVSGEPKGKLGGGSSVHIGIEMDISGGPLRPRSIEFKALKSDTKGSYAVPASLDDVQRLENTRNDTAQQNLSNKQAEERRKLRAKETDYSLVVTTNASGVYDDARSLQILSNNYSSGIWKSLVADALVQIDVNCGGIIERVAPTERYKPLEAALRVTCDEFEPKKKLAYDAINRGAPNADLAVLIESIGSDLIQHLNEALEAIPPEELYTVEIRSSARILDSALSKLVSLLDDPFLEQPVWRASASDELSAIRRQLDEQMALVVPSDAYREFDIMYKSALADVIASVSGLSANPAEWTSEDIAGARAAVSSARAKLAATVSQMPPS